MRRDRRGFALVIALLTGAAVFALAMDGAVAVRTATVEAAAMRDRARLLRSAESAVALVVAGLTTPAVSSVDDGAPGASGLEGAEEAPGREIPPFPLGVPLDLSRGKPEGEGKPTPGGADAPARTVRRIGPLTTLRRVGLPAGPVEVEVGGERCRVRIIDAHGGVNINTADEAALTRCFEAIALTPGEASAIAQQIVDWRDEDDFVRARGAERAEHARRGVAVRNGPFQNVEETLFLPAMTPAVFARARMDLCVEGDGRLHAGTASREALRSLPGVTASNVEALVRLRERGARMTEEEVRGALGLAAREAMDRLRLGPSGDLRAVVEFVSRPGARVEALVRVHEQNGIRVEVVPL